MNSEMYNFQSNKNDVLWSHPKRYGIVGLEHPTYLMPTDQWHQYDPIGQRGPDGMPQLPHVEELLKDYQDCKI